MVSKDLTKTLSRITSQDHAVRRQGLSALEDVLQHSRWMEADVEPLVAQLVRMVSSAHDDADLEQILYDLDLAFRVPQNAGNPAPTFAASLDPVVALIDRPGLSPHLICYGLDVLSISCRLDYRPVLERFTTHADARVRDTATVALVELAWAYLERGEVTAAHDVAEQAVLCAEVPETHRFARLVALCVRATMALADKQWDAVAQALNEGLTLARSRSPDASSYMEGRLLLISGQMQVAKGEPDLARQHVQAALAIFERLGARSAIEKTRNAIAALPTAQRYVAFAAGLIRRRTPLESLIVLDPGVVEATRALSTTVIRLADAGASVGAGLARHLVIGLQCDAAPKIVTALTTLA